MPASGLSLREAAHLHLHTKGEPALVQRTDRRPGWSQQRFDSAAGDMTDITSISTDLAAQDARHLTDRIRAALDTTWQMIRDAYLGRAWVALGYTSWDDYTTQEFGTARIRIPREERQEWVGSLRDSGLSIRAIAQATALSVGTIHAEAQVFKTEHVSPPVSDEHHDFPSADEWSPDEGFIESQVQYDDGEWSRDLEVSEPPLTNYNTGEVIEREQSRSITGLDGKKYNASTDRQTRRRSLVEEAHAANRNLHVAVSAIQSIVSDDRFNSNKADIQAALQPSIRLAVEVLDNLYITPNEEK